MLVYPYYIFDAGYSTKLCYPASSIVIIEQRQGKSMPFSKNSFPLDRGYCQHWLCARKKFIFNRFCTT